MPGNSFPGGSRISNTFGNHYMFDKVYITLEGEPYESGHIMMEDYFPTDYREVEGY